MVSTHCDKLQWIVTFWNEGFMPFFFRELFIDILNWFNNYCRDQKNIFFLFCDHLVPEPSDGEYPTRATEPLQ